LLLSILLHLLVVNKVQWHWPEKDEPVTVIETRLVEPPAPVKAVSPIRPQLKKPPKLIPPPKVEQVPEPVATESPVPDTQTDTPVEAAAGAEEVVPSEAAPVVDDAPDADSPQPPNYVYMEYELRRNGDSGSIGQVTVLYNKQRDGTYELRSETKAQGLAALFVSGALIQRSSGVVDEHGLQPMHFAYEFGSNSDKHQYADFDWGNGRLIMRSARGEKSIALPPGTQDQLSFMYQYMFVPPLVNMQLLVTNGKKLGRYSYTFEGEESISTKLGDIQTLHIAKSSGEGEEKTELWLAINYHYLPIKIRKTEKDGKSYEQLMTRLSTE